MYYIRECPLLAATVLYISQTTSSTGVSLAVGAERKRGADQQDALALAAQLRVGSQGGGGGASGGSSGIAGGGGGEGAAEKEKKLKNLRKV